MNDYTIIDRDIIYQCQSCGILNDLLLCEQCNHSLCENCFIGFGGRESEVLCPKCEMLSTFYIPNIEQQLEISSIKVKCNNPTCNHVLLYANFQHHKQQCGLTPIEICEACADMHDNEKEQVNCLRKSIQLMHQQLATIYTNGANNRAQVDQLKQIIQSNDEQLRMLKLALLK